MNVWIMIVTAALVSYLLRAWPVIIMHKIEINEKSAVIHFLRICSVAIIGSIVYSVAFSNASITHLFTTHSATPILNFIYLTTTFFVATKIHNKLICFLICFSSYVLLYSIVSFLL